MNTWQEYLPCSIDSDLLGIINKLLQIKAEDRYQSPSVVLADLQCTPQASKALHPSIKSRQSFSFDSVRVNQQGKITSRSQKKAQFFSEDLCDRATLQMIKIPGGTFLMGSSEDEPGRHGWEGPQHQVTVTQFFMSRYPVTQSQWQAVMGVNPSHFKGSNRPVEQVSWEEAVEFCRKLTSSTGRDYRLPSEAEWEYACRAGMTTPFHFGETITSELANYNSTTTYRFESKGDYRGQTTDVDSFPPNAYGLSDMHGNIFEWCMDTFHNRYDGAPTDGNAWIDAVNRPCVTRGGPWILESSYCRSASRERFNPDSLNYLVGFRVALSIPPSP